jgi:hypothetical protein
VLDCPPFTAKRARDVDGNDSGNLPYEVAQTVCSAAREAH